MSLKSELKKIWQILEKYFLVQFFLSLTILSFAILVLDIKTSINNYVIVSLGLFSLLILSFIWFKKGAINKYKKIVSAFLFHLAKSSLIVSVVILFLVTYQNYIHDPLPESFLLYAILALVASIFILLKDLEISPTQTNDSSISHISRKELIRSKNERTLLMVAILVAILFTGVKLFLIPHQAFENDEGYTHTVNLGYERWGEMSTSDTGVIYARSPVYNYVLSLVHVATGDSFLGLRLFNVMIWLLVAPFMYLAIRRLFSAPVAMLSFVLIQSNWFVMSMLLAGRSYTFAFIFSFFALYFILKTIISFKEKSPFILSLTLALVFMVLNFFEGHIAFTYHLLPMFGLALLFGFFGLEQMKAKLAIISIGLGSVLLMAVYVFLINPSFGYFLLNIFSFKPAIKFIHDFGSIFSYFTVFGIALFCSSIIFSIHAYKNKHPGSFAAILLCFFVSFTYLIHSTILVSKTRFFAYLSDLVIPLILLVSYLLWYAYSSKKPLLKVFSVIALLVIVISNVHNYIGMYNGVTSWRLDARPFTQMWEQIPDGATVLTDQMLLAPIALKNQKVYTIFRWVNDDEIVNEKLEQDIVSENPFDKQNFSQTEKERFSWYLNTVIKPQYVTVENQLYSVYSGHPVAMDTEHIEEIQEQSHNKTLYILFTHTAFDKRAVARNPELHSYIFENMDIVSEYTIDKNTYNDQWKTETQHLLTLGVIHLE